MKTSNLLILGIIGAGYLYTKKKRDAEPVAVVVPSTTPSPVLTAPLPNTGVVPPGFIKTGSGEIVNIEPVPMTFTSTPKLGRIVVVDRGRMGALTHFTCECANGKGCYSTSGNCDCCKSIAPPITRNRYTTYTPLKTAFL